MALGLGFGPLGWLLDLLAGGNGGKTLKNKGKTGENKEKHHVEVLGQDIEHALEP